MAKLSDKEKALLEKLQAKAEAPDAPAVGRNLNVTIDLGDPKQVALAIKHGFLGSDDIEDDDDDDAGSDNGGEDTPRRKGFFGDA